jgi:hypothetical protein
VMKKPQRPDFAARDEVLGKLQEKIQEFSTKAKTAASELDALQNEAKTNSKMEACRRGLANTVHTKTQAKVRVARSCQRWEATLAKCRLSARTGITRHGSPHASRLIICDCVLGLMIGRALSNSHPRGGPWFAPVARRQR